jgi:putative ABC transport system permease protein
MRTLIQDVRYALRLMMRNRAATAVALFSLAISIGPAAAIFSVIDAIGFRPLAIRDPEHLIRLYSGDARDRQGDTSYADFIEIRSGVEQFAEIAAWRSGAVGVSGGERPPEITLMTAVSERFFPLLGVAVEAGRPFRDDETAANQTAPVILISDNYWTRRYDRAATAIDSTICLNGSEYRIVGVLPASFRGLDKIFHADIWVPIGAEPHGRRGPIPQERRTLGIVARLRDGRTLLQAQAELDALAARLATMYPDTHANRSITIEFEAAARRKWVAPAAAALLVIPFFVLLIGCANVAGLMIGRAEARRTEIATRLALGAGRRRLVRQFLTESALLAIPAGALGLLVGYWVIRLLPALLPELPVPLGLEFRLDARVVAFTMAIALLAVPIFGLAPAVFASNPRIAAMLGGGARGRGSSRTFTFRNVLTVGQIAGSLALLVMAGLLVRSFANSSQIDVGFVKRPMILTTLAPGIAGYDEAQTFRFLGQLVERVSALPSIESATLARHMPLNSLFGGGGTIAVRIPDHEPPDGEPRRFPYNVVEQHYFSTMGIRILRGRPFTSADRWPGSGVVLINQTMAQRFWPDGDSIGRWIELVDRRQPEQRRCEIVGIVEDGKYVTLNEPSTPYVYLPFAQQAVGEVTVIMRTHGREAAAMQDFRLALRALDPAMPAMQIITLDEHMNVALMFERTAAILAGSLGVLALLLALVGLYGVIAFIASRRTREIGIRIALGARPGDVLAQVLKQGGRFAVTGITMGLLLGGAAAQLMRNVLYGVSSYDPLTYAGTGAVVLAVALAATYIPARRAARVDPIHALRCE